ncbi:hypothetical protein BOTNAR_0172g00020 [Botryotinia narcissicola]|uniref:Uncharacterized protein n=1 Tax=Botryotinia narcissicola TaxID=278944 RepID=A0A4Z1IQD5_9HELO|nr:hypothetical protein BOTNAR_0172g00020 [Botryotinia narcissicola]
MEKRYVNWTDLEKDYLRRHGPKPGGNVEPEIWVELTQGLNNRIKEWCEKHPFLQLGKSYRRKPWERTLIAVEGYYENYGFSELYPEKGPAAKAKNLVKAVTRYTKDTESSKYPPELDLQLKIMINDNPNWTDILKKCKELGGEGNQYTHGSVRNRHTKFLKGLTLEQLEDRAKKVVTQQNASDCLPLQPSDGESSSTQQEVERPLRITERRDSDAHISTDRRDESNKGESPKNRRDLPVPKLSAGSSSGSRREEKRPVCTTKQQAEASKTSTVVAERADIGNNRQHRRTSQALALAGGSGNDQQRPAAKTEARYPRQESQRKREENRRPRETSVKRGKSRDQYREREDFGPELELDGEIDQRNVKCTGTGRSHSPDKQGARDSRREKNAENRRKQERQNIFGRR